MLGYVESEYATVGQDCKVRLLDKMMPARLIAESPYDPESLVLKA
jgi:dimethylglycine dehydrogenase